MRKSILSLFLFMSPALVNAQPDIQWKKAYGGSLAEGFSSAPNARFDIQQTTDGGYVFIGTASSTDGDVTGNDGGTDMWVVKTDNTGTIQWQKTLGGTGADIGSSVMQTTDGGYIACGYTNSNDGDVTGAHGQNDIWVVKLTSTGAISWQKALGGSSFDEFAYSVIQTADGGYAVTSITYSSDGDVVGGHGSAIDIWVVKLTSTGTISWQKCLGGTGIEMAGSIAATADGGYIVAGSAATATGDIKAVHGGTDGWLIKLSAAGAIEWEKTYGGTKLDHFSMAYQTADGGYIATGGALSKDHDITSTHDSTELWVVKTNDTGKIVWSKTYGGSLMDRGLSISQGGDGNYLVSGTTYSNDGDVSGLHGTNQDMFLMALYPDGGIRWTKLIGSNGNESTSRIRATSDGGCIVISNLNDTTGDGSMAGHHGQNDIFVVKLSSTTNIETMSAKNNIKVYPNPATGIINVELVAINNHTQLKLTDINGKLLRTVDVKSEKFAVDITDFPAGIYLLEYNDGENKQVIKLTKL